ncbi:hypothetical protein [Paenibacillus sp. DR312]|uniref:hypothetical protein n=1 Tax=unclassified Paenibacillus TaxID=185978 RepID=UPI001C9829D0|nr:hypothetical protein [Paenibacillus sp. DR312]QZN77359.1 hypothetical protein K5K90_09255 [Paenibacillus sp. DR312]
MAGVRIKLRLERFYHVVDFPHLEVFAFAECVDDNVYYQHTDGEGEMEWMPIYQFYRHFERIQD